MNLRVNRHLAFETLPGPDASADGARNARAELAAQFIAAGTRVLDLSGGGTAFQALLPHGCIYRTGACATGIGDFPAEAAAHADLMVMLGGLEKIIDLESFFSHLAACRRDVILSYPASDFGTVGDCDNRLSFYELARLFDRHGLRIACTAPMDGGEVLFRLTPASRLHAVTACSVVVVSGDDAETFGGRLRRQMVNALLPGEAEIHHLSVARLHEARAPYDLLVLGAGGGFFPPLLDGALFELMGRCKATIGIFGTQYRELIPRPSLERLIERLDVWYARYEDDALMFGCGRGNVVHLGDWLIDRFPLARASEDEPLQIGASEEELVLDRAIETIQRHRWVYSEQLAALLCALTSAECAAFAEPPSARMAGAASGSFRSMLIDVFGRTYPERQFFLVDRDAVARYKARVRRNVTEAGERIEAILRNVATA
jgi:hypothetical protein